MGSGHHCATSFIVSSILRVINRQLPDKTELIEEKERDYSKIVCRECHNFAANCLPESDHSAMVWEERLLDRSY